MKDKEINTLSTTSNEQKSEELTVEKLQEAIDIINKLPPAVICFKCSSITRESLKDGSHSLIRSGVLDGFWGVPVEIDNCLVKDQLLIEYSDGTSKKFEF